MGKMYYSEEEACQKLGVDADGLMTGFIQTAKLQMYQDGANHVFKADDVDALVGDDGASLSDADSTPDVGGEMRKEDTVITAEGISIFDDEELEIEEADPMANTQIAPSLDDHIALDGVGSGSGLLDLTRESDDTSLGAGIFDGVDIEGIGSGLGSGLGTGLGSGLGSGIGSDIGLGSGFDNGMSTAPVGTMSTGFGGAPPTFVEAVDPSSGLFSGLLVGAAMLMLVVAAVSLGGLYDNAGLSTILQNNLAILIVGGIVLAIVAAIVGFMVGKSFQQKNEAMQRTEESEPVTEMSDSL
ncbi:MAG: phage holin family protein [Phycisphaerae bacterium]|nr:phage holin family protein [Phycisphaerae bacterium]